MVVRMAGEISKREEAVEEERWSQRPALRRVGEKSQSSIQVRLPAAVGTGDNVPRFQRNGKLPEGPVVGNGQGRQHADILGATRKMTRTALG